jgi:hypothetical protein
MLYQLYIHCGRRTAPEGEPVVSVQQRDDELIPLVEHYQPTEVVLGITGNVIAYFKTEIAAWEAGRAVWARFPTPCYIEHWKEAHDL